MKFHQVDDFFGGNLNHPKLGLLLSIASSIRDLFIIQMEVTPEKVTNGTHNSQVTLKNLE